MSIKTETDKDKIEEILTRSIDTIYPTKEALKEALMSGKQMRIYIGIDPTATYAHLGHATNYMILKKFHDLGHRIIVLIGDFTAMLGDPSDKNETRERLTREQVEKNMATFKDQIGKILPFEDMENPIEFKHNSEWLSKLGFDDIIKLASNFTAQQILERDRFEKRIKEGKPLYFHETFYPLMQGYDSVAMDVDIELCGTDQTFNALAGRTILKRYKNKEKFVITTTLLIDPKTGEKLMSKSLGTGVGINLGPKEMFAKVMALPDSGIGQVFVDCTYLSLKEIDGIMKSAEQNPFEAKKRLAKEIVEIYHGKSSAEKAQDDWTNTFSKRETPTDIQEVITTTGKLLVDVLLENKLIESKSDFRRLIKEGAISLDGEKVLDDKAVIEKSGVYRIGKHRFLK